MTKIGSIVSLGMALFLLALTPSSLRAQGLFSITLDLAHLPVYLVDAYNKWKDGVDKRELQRRKDSVALLSAHMSRIAATKRDLADFLKDHPLSPGRCGNVHDQFKCDDPRFQEAERNSGTVDHQFRKLDREISGLQDDLDDIDSTWAAKNPKLDQHLYRVGHGKGLEWASHQGSTDVDAFRKWLYKEADEFEAAVREIRERFPS